MFVINIAVVVTGLVLLTHQVKASCGCSNNCGIHGVDSWATSLGLSGAGNERIWGPGGAFSSGVNGIVGLENGGSIGPDGNVNTDAPIVVRPQELPKPPVALPVSLSPIAGPCVCKKAIVKPAVLPKPVYRPPVRIIGGTYGMGYGESTMNKYHTTSTVIGSSSGGEGGTIIGSPIVLDKNSMYLNNQANLAPADAVSLSLAYQTAQQTNRVPLEDRLTFGFRKIPEEIPRQVVYKKNIPEEQIFNMNGQIVELKPVQLGSPKTLEEEAHEDLLDLQEEENEGRSYSSGSGYRRLSLGEIGYGPAQIEKKTFVDVPSGSIGEAIEEVASNAASSAASALGSAAGAVGDLLGGGKKNGFVAGNVVYKTVPKLSQMLTPLPETAPDQGECQSQEASEHQSLIYDEGSSTGSHLSCGMCCNPCCTAHTFQSSSSSVGKKASVLVQRLTS